MKVLGSGRFLRLIERNGWELVERPGIAVVVAIAAVTEADELVLVEQYREPLAARVLELPAGLVGDEPSRSDETPESAARRELEEETGYRADTFERLTEGPPSPGQSSEVVSLLVARDAVRVSSGGGVGEESIEVHLVPLEEAREWIGGRARLGVRIDPKIWAALYFLTS